jgi:hypothetical protein
VPAACSNTKVCRAAIRERGTETAHNRRKKTVPAEGGTTSACGHVKPDADEEAEGKARSRKLTWANCLRRVHFFDVPTCNCGGRREVIAALIDPAMAEKILRHVGLWRSPELDEVTEIRGPPEDLGPVLGQQGQDWEPPPPVEWTAWRGRGGQGPWPR